jgi:hypothetical protein
LTVQTHKHFYFIFIFDRGNDNRQDPIILRIIEQRFFIKNGRIFFGPTQRGEFISIKKRGADRTDGAGIFNEGRKDRDDLGIGETGQRIDRIIGGQGLNRRRYREITIDPG